MKYRLTDRAEGELAELLAFSKERWGEKQTEKYAQSIEDGLTMLCDHPRIGAPQTHLREDVRKWRIGSHLFYYAVESDELLVLVIRHTRQAPLTANDLF